MTMTFHRQRSTAVSKRDNVTSQRQPKMPPLPSIISSIISHFVRISSESCDAITFVANEADSNNHAARTDDRIITIVHRIVNLIVEFIKHYAGYSD